MILEVTLDKSRELGVVVPRRRSRSTSPGSTTRASLSAASNPAQDALFPAGALTETMLAGVLGPVLIARRGHEPAGRVDRDPRHPVVRRAHQGAADQQRRRRAVEPAPPDHEQRGRRDLGRLALPFPVSTLGLRRRRRAGRGRRRLPASRACPASSLDVQRENVALELKLTPHVNEHDMVRLEVDEKISELAPGTQQPRPVDVGADREDDRRRQGSADRS